MTLTKAASKAHRHACRLLEQETLSDENRFLIYEKFHEAADLDSRAHSAHFTPIDLAWDFRLDVHGDKILDLCAGIGILAFACSYMRGNYEDPPALVCVEKCERYVEVGKKLLPEAQWICGDIFDPDLQSRLKEMNLCTVIGNPPFGKAMMKDRKAPRYKGSVLEYAALDIAATLAKAGAFIIPQTSSPFRFSGTRCYEDVRQDQDNRSMAEYRRFAQATGLELRHGVGVDTSIYEDRWKGVQPKVEIVTFDLEEHDADVSEAWLSNENKAAEQLQLF